MALMDQAEAIWEAQRFGREVFVQQEMHKTAEALVKENKRKLVRLIEETGENSVKFDVRPTDEELPFVNQDVAVTASLNHRTTVTYDADGVEKAVEKKLGRTAARTIVKRTYTVNDWDGLVAWAKSLGASPDEFLKFFSVSKEVDQKELDRAYEFGTVILDDFDGCYKVKASEPYVVFRTRRL